MNKQVFFLNFSCRQSLVWRLISQNGRINNPHYHIISHIPVLPICPYCLSVYFVVCSDFLLPSAVRWERACAWIPNIITSYISTIFSSFLKIWHVWHVKSYCSKNFRRKYISNKMYLKNNKEVENTCQTCQMSESRFGVPFWFCIFLSSSFCNPWREIVIRGGKFFIGIIDFPVVDRRNNSSEYSNSLEVHAFYTVDGTKNPPHMRGNSSVRYRQARPKN